jgi:hypothetical protein
LGTSQRRRLLKLLLQGAQAHGYRTQLWTTVRIAEVIEREFGVHYHRDHVGRLMHSLNWSPQKPERRALEGDEKAVERCKRKDWPRVKKTLGGWAPTSSLPMNRASCWLPWWLELGRPKAALPFSLIAKDAETKFPLSRESRSAPDDSTWASILCFTATTSGKKKCADFSANCFATSGVPSSFCWTTPPPTRACLWRGSSADTRACTSSTFLPTLPTSTPMKGFGP